MSRNPNDQAKHWREFQRVQAALAGDGGKNTILLCYVVCTTVCFKREMMSMSIYHISVDRFSTIFSQDCTGYSQYILQILTVFEDNKFQKVFMCCVFVHTA